MPVTDIKRPNYYEGQYLGALDLVAAQEYQRQQDQRHRLAAHTWGIAVGLELEERTPPGGGNVVDVVIKPGYAVDGFGRTIVVLEPRNLREELFAQFLPDPALPDGRWIPVWLRYREEKTDPPRPGFAACNVEEQAYRIRETFREVVGPLTTSQQRSRISVAGKSVDAEAEVADASVPYQALPEEGDRPLWLIPLGYVRWSGSHFVKSVTDDEKKKTREGRRYISVVAASVLAPADDLRLRPRAAFADADAADFARVEGRLRVDGRIVAQKDIFLHGGKLSFQNTGGQDENTLLWIQRRAGAGGAGSDLRVHIGEPGSATTRLTIGPGPADSSDEQVVLAVKGDDTVDIPTGSLNFGSQTRQMLNLWQTQYGIGVQSSTLYFRTDADFCWFRGGSHSSTRSEPGGGVLAMKLDSNSDLTIDGAVTTRGNLVVGGELFLGSTKVPVDVMVGEINLENGGGGAISGTHEHQIESRLPNVEKAQLTASLSNITSGDRAFVNATIVPRRVNANTFVFMINYGFSGPNLVFSYVAIFVP